MTFRIGLDLHVVDGKFQGSRTHVLCLFAELIALAPTWQFYVFLEKHAELLALDARFSLPNVTLVKMPHTNPFKRLLWQLPRLQRHYQLDLLHTQYILPFPCFSAGMVTIHDILFETHPQYFTRLFRWRSQLLMRLAAQKAQHIFTVSEYSRQQLAEYYPVALDKITVIYNGVNTQRFFPSQAGLAYLSARQLQTKAYILSVGRLEPRKNHLTLLHAYAHLMTMGQSLPPLVLVGQRDFHFNAIFTAIEALNLATQVRIIEDVGEEELAALYRHAQLFVYPAFAEGFGMPILEAMASGVPVISSNLSAIPEVVGEAGILINPNNVQELAQAMQLLLSDPQLSHAYSVKGLTQIKKFTWKIAAELVYKHYLIYAESARKK